jgi:hypothetical protein
MTLPSLRELPSLMGYSLAQFDGRDKSIYLMSGHEFGHLMVGDE